MGSIISLVTGALGGIWGYVAAVAIAAIMAGSVTGYVVHRMDDATINSMKLADSQVQVKAVQLAEKMQATEDKEDLDAAVSEAAAQQKIITQTLTVTKEVQVHVPDTSHCNNGPTFGLVRMLNAAAAVGPDPDTFPTTAGQSDDSCAPVSWRNFTQDLANDYGAGRQNAEQLNALEANVTSLVSDANGASSK